jgi:hypothetical protein
MSELADPAYPQHNAAALASEQSAKELLQHKMRLAQELVDIRHDRVRAIALQLLGERPPDPEGIERLRRVTRDLEAARESLIDATCRWHYFVVRGNVLR